MRECRSLFLGSFSHSRVRFRDRQIQSRVRFVKKLFQATLFVFLYSIVNVPVSLYETYVYLL